MSVSILTGDCVASMAALPAGAFQTCVTSPPYYGLRDYGHTGQIGLEGTPDAYTSRLVAVFRAVHRVLRDDGTVFLNLGDSYNNFRSTMGPGQTLHGYDLRDKPRPDSRARGWGGAKEKDLLGIPWMAAFALRADGWYLRSAIVWAKPNPMPESVLDRPSSSYEMVFMLTKQARYFFNSAAIAEPAEKGAAGGAFNEGKTAARQFGRASNMTRAETDTRNARNVWTIATQPYSGSHFATMPPDLAERCILAGSRPGDCVLDPFGGAGTTGLVADRLQRHATMIELNPVYAAMARRRIHDDAPLLAEAAQ